MQTKLTDMVRPSTAPLRTVRLVAATAAVLGCTLLGARQIVAQPPPRPSDLTATVVSASQINLMWVNNPPLGTEIRVFRSSDGINFMQIDTLPRTATTYTSTGLLASVEYFYQVKAHNLDGDSDPSNTASDTTFLLLRLEDVCPGKITVAWRSASVDDHYSIQRSTTGNPDDFTEIATVPTPGNSYTDSGLADGTYFYRIQAFRAASSPVSNTVRTTLGGTGAAIDHSDGFADHGDLTANGTAKFPGTFLQLTEAVGTQDGSAFYSQPPTPQVDISTFSTSFTFRIHDPTFPEWADGMTFVIHNDPRGASALGPGGGGLGYGPDNIGAADCRAAESIRNSVAIKLDIWPNLTEGTNSTGIFTDGRSPTVRCPGDIPADAPDKSVDMQGTPIQLRDDHIKRVDLDYDGTTLTETITDLVTMGQFTTTYMVDIPSFVGGSTAYVGFTGATGGVWAVQEIQTWTFGGTPSPFPRSPKGLRVTSVSGSDVTTAWKCNNPRILPQGFEIERSDNGGDFTLINTVDVSQLSYTDPGLADGNYCYRVRAFNDLGDSTPSNVYCISLPVPALVDHSGGFAIHDDLTGNGRTTPPIFTAGLARLTSGGFGQAASVFTNSRVDITNFRNTFTFQMCVSVMNPSCATPVPGEGITFTIQGNAPTALGSSVAGSRGYAGIGNSVAVKFSIFENQPTETDNATGLFTDAHSPTVPAPGSSDFNVPIAKSVLDFKSEDLFEVAMAYDVTTLTLLVTITDTVTGFSATQAYTVDIPSQVGSNLGYVGFTGGTSTHTARQDVQTWTFMSGLGGP